MIDHHLSDQRPSEPCPSDQALLDEHLLDEHQPDEHQPDEHQPDETQPESTTLSDTSLAGTIVLDVESREKFLHLIGNLNRELSPECSIEAHLTRSVAVARAVASDALLGPPEDHHGQPDSSFEPTPKHPGPHGSCL